jgi:hypothetical protein
LCYKFHRTQACRVTLSVQQRKKDKETETDKERGKREKGGGEKREINRKVIPTIERN